MHLHCGFSAARLLKNLAPYVKLHMQWRQDLSLWEHFQSWHLWFKTIKSKSLSFSKVLPCSSRSYDQSHRKTLLFGLFFLFLKGLYTPPKTNMCPKNGPYQKERLVFQPLFLRGHSLVFWGVIHTFCSIRDSSNNRPVLSVIRFRSNQPLDGAVIQFWLKNIVFQWVETTN